MTKGRYGHHIGKVISVVDIAILILCYLGIRFFMPGYPVFESTAVALTFVLAMVVVAFFFRSIHYQRAAHADRVAIRSVQAAVAFALLSLALTTLLREDVEWTPLLTLYLIYGVMLTVWWQVSRKVIKHYRQLGFNYKRVVIVGGGAVCAALVKEMENDLGYGYRILAVFAETPEEAPKKYYKGSLDDVSGFLANNVADELYCLVTGTKDNQDQKFMKIAEANAIDYFYVPQIRNITQRLYELDNIGKVSIMALRSNPLSNPWNRLVKRSFDILFSACTLILSPIVLIPVAIGIKLSSPGPIFFKQLRTGYRGNDFLCYKFRTMHINDESDSQQATKNDPRKFRFGDFLRRSSIDELPQFWNVFKGDMSVVGPRPHMVAHTKTYSTLIDQYMLRHTIKPGITGWAQVSGFRGPTDHLWQMEKRVEHDVWYAEHWNLLLDLKIIFLTIRNAIKGDENAF